MKFKEPNDGPIELYEAVKATGAIPQWECAIDGGANIGDWTNALANDFDKVIAFEPMGEAFERLRDRMKGDDRDNVEINCAALGRYNGFGNMVFPPSKTASTAGYFQPRLCGGTRSVRLDDMLIDQCDFIKLDLEGGEYDAISGAQKILRKLRPVVLVEITDRLSRYQKQPDDVVNLMSYLGYYVHETFGENVLFTPS